MSNAIVINKPGVQSGNKTVSTMWFSFTGKVLICACSENRLLLKIPLSRVINEDTVFSNKRLGTLEAFGRRALIIS